MKVCVRYSLNFWLDKERILWLIKRERDKLEDENWNSKKKKKSSQNPSKNLMYSSACECVCVCEQEIAKDDSKYALKYLLNKSVWSLKALLVLSVIKEYDNCCDIISHHTFLEKKKKKQFDVDIMNWTK